MPRGLGMPVGVGKDGGARVVEGDENDRKIISLALGSDDNENAFQQDIGLGEGMIFEVIDESLKPTVIRRLVEIFKRFELQQRFILLSETITWSVNSADQTAELSFDYVQIESDQVKEFTQKVTRA